MQSIATFKGNTITLLRSGGSRKGKGAGSCVIKASVGRHSLPICRTTVGRLSLDIFAQNIHQYLVDRGLYYTSSKELNLYLELPNYHHREVWTCMPEFLSTERVGLQSSSIPFNNSVESPATCCSLDLQSCKSRGHCDI